MSIKICRFFVTNKQVRDTEGVKYVYEGRKVGEKMCLWQCPLRLMQTKAFRVVTKLLKGKIEKF